MATTTSTRGKTKTAKTTSKAKTTKAAKTTRATKSTKAKTSRVSAAAKAKTAVAVKPAAKSPAVAKKMAWSAGSFLALGALLYAGLAAAVFFLMKSVTYPVTLTHLTNDALLSHDSTVFISASKPLMDIDLRWMLVGLMVVSLVLPVLYLTKLKGYYAERIAKRRVIEARWIDLGLTSALMIYVVGLMCGIHDLMLLKLMSGFMITTCALGWLAERQNENAPAPVWSAFNISVFTGVLPWLVIGATKTATLVFGDVRSPWYDYAACIALLVGFSLLARNQMLQHRRKIADYAVVERNYVVLNLLTKVSFVTILLIGLHK